MPDAVAEAVGNIVGIADTAGIAGGMHLGQAADTGSGIVAGVGYDLDAGEYSLAAVVVDLAAGVSVVLTACFGSCDLPSSLAHRVYP
jgi:hypothetical protein